MSQHDPLGFSRRARGVEQHRGILGARFRRDKRFRSGQKRGRVEDSRPGIAGFGQSIRFFDQRGSGQNQPHARMANDLGRLPRLKQEVDRDHRVSPEQYAEERLGIPGNSGKQETDFLPLIAQRPELHGNPAAGVQPLAERDFFGSMIQGGTPRPLGKAIQKPGGKRFHLFISDYSVGAQSFGDNIRGRRHFSGMG